MATAVVAIAAVMASSSSAFVTDLAAADLAALVVDFAALREKSYVAVVGPDPLAAAVARLVSRRMPAQEWQSISLSST